MKVYIAIKETLIPYEGTETEILNVFYILPAATTEAIGGIKKAGKVDNLATDAELSTVISKVNTLLSNLRSIGVLTL